MLKRILQKDLARNKVVTVALFIFILLAAMLVSSATNIIMELTSSMASLFRQSRAPHYVQMYSGELNQNSINEFTASTPSVKEQQTVELININGRNIFLGNEKKSQTDSVLENSFVRQNSKFDFLLNMDNEIFQVENGEIGVPVYYMKQNNLNIGDKIQIVNGDFFMEFTIKDFVRDVQMNPSLVTSKRFLISDGDWNTLYANLGESEYLIEFLLNDINKISEFEMLYQSTNLPQTGTSITYSLYQVLNALSDGIVVAIIILISVLLIIISTLCLRFTLIATIEEDYREIGVMKAIGIQSANIRKLYLAKYLLITALASFFGYITSLFIGTFFTENINLYMGTVEKSAFSVFIPLIGSVIVFIAVIFFCNLILKRFNKISAVEALKTGTSMTTKRNRYNIKLYKSKITNVNFFLGLNEVTGRFTIYSLLCFVYAVCIFLMIVPLNFLNTIQSPEFITYMGAGQSDIRIDLQQTSETQNHLDSILKVIESDNDIEKYASFITSSYKIVNPDGTIENMKIENGDFSTFPLEYVKGSAPTNENEIALSVINSDELGKSVGDNVSIFSEEDNELILTVSGIYQDVTYGGKTAKAMLPCKRDTILWYIINLNMKPGVNLTDKLDQYRMNCYPAKVTNMDDYVSQTLGSVISQLRLVITLAVILSVSISGFITAMFFKMLIAKDTSQIAIMLSLGFSTKNIRTQYIVRALLVLTVGIILGIIASNTIGQKIAGLLLSGISNLQFITNPLIVYIICPITLIITVSVAITAISMTIKKIKIMSIIE
ncbi:FtsX-like permease family protein [Clostridioides sp. ZZV15-6598]|uniref:ABC transporter permease n=1 Tax=Clostridioides sp. ZZV15-6598 TaxID=2811501 RepID=UPI001D125E3B|nr:FtsX-like permease family protein [Clostridioides sp. ZZV15-6598]